MIEMLLLFHKYFDVPYMNLSPLLYPTYPWTTSTCAYVNDDVPQNQQNLSLIRFKASLPLMWQIVRVR